MSASGSSGEHRALLSLCGFRCDLCLAWRPNLVRDPSAASALSDGWNRYFGFRIPPERIACGGCTMDSGQTLDSDCPVRPCAMGRGVENCASCSEYVCGILEERLVSREEIEARLGRAVPEDDYRSFIAPYENRKRLDGIRESLAGGSESLG